MHVDVVSERVEQNGKPVQADWKAMVPQTTRLYNRGEQKSISECTIHQTFRQLDYKSRRPRRVPFNVSVRQESGQLKIHQVFNCPVSVISHEYNLDVCGAHSDSSSAPVPLLCALLPYCRILAEAVGLTIQTHYCFLPTVEEGSRDVQMQP